MTAWASTGRIVAAIVLAAALWSCGEDERPYRQGSIDPDYTPTMTTLRANTVITDSGYPRYRILAPTWLMFDEAEEPRWTFPDGMHMEQYDNSGNIHSTIDCDSAVYFTGRQTWRLDGAVDIASTEGQRFLTQQLWWDRIHHEVYSDSFIHIERPDRVIEGFGFKSDERMTRYMVIRPSGIFPASQFENNPGGDESASTSAPASTSVDAPYDAEAAAASDPTDAQRTDSAFNGVPTDTIFVSDQSRNRPQRRAARAVLRRRTPYSRQQTDTSATEPRKQLPTPATVTSTHTATTLQNPTRQ